ncbi:hypothetical protein IQ269_13190 [Tychonema sp. LEGE 07199]|uniref:hypothetical protein n=1 Tax=unclassified Tychonema TaxID=2642144 RepID=UPI00187F9E31|nr:MULTISPECIES: hypothetical protein [unclassified Tychonema]MBE9121731.1 hypothetical protein [Tychonema sp. LEGE 07199]MBE9133849.1 hypothetical protein [Tychonema sp. LEGE 07196]
MSIKLDFFKVEVVPDDRSWRDAYQDNIQGYMDGKDEFIQEIDRKAVNWRSPD